MAKSSKGSNHEVRSSLRPLPGTSDGGVISQALTQASKQASHSFTKSPSNSNMSLSARRNRGKKKGDRKREGVTGRG